MRALRESRTTAAWARVLACVLLLLPSAAMAADAPPPPATPRASAADTLARTPVSLDEARELIKNADYDHAIERLRAAVDQKRDDPEALRDAYLLLIKTYVFLGNKFKFEPQGREASNLNYREARELIGRMLAVPALRHTRPEPATDYPPEMLSAFADVRAQLFGAFRVLSVQPSGATVWLDGDTLRATSMSGARGESDLPIGKHRVVVRHPGYREAAEDIVISPSATLERTYRLDKKKGAMWYATRGGAALGIVGGVVGLLAGKSGGGGTTLQPLPGAPPPPSK